MNSSPQPERPLVGRDAPVKSVERSIDILLELASGPLTLTEVSVATHLSKSTSRRLLRSLGHGGIVVHDPLSKKYLLGPGALRLGQGFVGVRGGFDTFARKPLMALWEKAGETVAVHVRLGQQRVCVHELASVEEVRYVSGEGMTAPIHVGSAGRVLLAFMPPLDARALLEGLDLAPMTGGPAVDLETYMRELDTVRGRGFALSVGERVRGAAAVSVPVFDAAGVTIAALSILGPVDRFDDQKRMAAVDLMRRAAEEIQTSLRTLDYKVLPPPAESRQSPA